MLSSEDVFDILGLTIIGIIPEDELVLSASNSGIPVTLNMQSKAGMAFNNVARRVIGEDVPFMNLDEQPGHIAAARRAPQWPLEAVQRPGDSRNNRVPAKETLMTNLLSRLFGRAKKGSGATAKDRLRFVLQHDRINLPPERMEEMKREILAVIVKYLVVDKDRVEIDLEQRDRTHSKLVGRNPRRHSYAGQGPEIR